jgi:tRNA dimethylallyltransferase
MSENGLIASGSGDRPFVVFLMGPTGAGKSDLAIRIACDLPVEIISVDSAMVFRALDIGTAKPTADERRQVPHFLIDIRDPGETYSAADFRADALGCIAAIWNRGRLPLLVGGTGLYFRTLERGLSPVPPADPVVRALIDKRAREMGWHALHEELKQKDPVAATKIHQNDPQRIQRALEVYELTGRPISEIWGLGRDGKVEFERLKVVWAPASRRQLGERLGNRFMQMLQLGLIEECRRVQALFRLEHETPARRLVGYRQVWDYLDGKLSREAMVETAVAATRQLAKRQYTWLRSEEDAVWLDPEASDSAEILRQLIVTIVRQRLS